MPWCDIVSPYNLIFSLLILELYEVNPDCDFINKKCRWILSFPLLFSYYGQILGKIGFNTSIFNV